MIRYTTDCKSTNLKGNKQEKMNIRLLKLRYYWTEGQTDMLVKILDYSCKREERIGCT